MANVASAPDAPPQTQESPDKDIPHKPDYDFETDEEEWRVKQNIKELKKIDLHWKENIIKKLMI